MPQVEAQRYLRFANHRIGVYDPSDPMAPLSVRE
jgi:hypothetical protein